MEQKERKVFREAQEFLEILVHLAPLETKGMLGSPVSQELQGQLGLLAP